jgi:hypothetical protein
MIEIKKMEINSSQFQKQIKNEAPLKNIQKETNQNTKQEIPKTTFKLNLKDK